MTETEQQEPRGKGRPTPKRSDARAARKKPLVTPKGGDGAKARRTETAAIRQTVRAALRSGDERHYPPMHAGPERAAVRDTVDARRSFAWTAMPLWALGLVLVLTPSPVTQQVGSTVLLLIVGVLVADSWLTSREVRAALDARWPDGTQTRRRTLVLYGVVRNTQFRRQRLPKPRVGRGSA